MVRAANFFFFFPSSFYMQVPGGFIKGQRLAKLSISGDKINLPTWFDQLEKSFSYKDSSVQTVLPACENQLPPAKNVKKKPRYLHV